MMPLKEEKMEENDARMKICKETGSNTFQIGGWYESGSEVSSFDKWSSRLKMVLMSNKQSMKNIRVILTKKMEVRGEAQKRYQKR